MNACRARKLLTLMLGITVSTFGAEGRNRTQKKATATETTAVKAFGSKAAPVTMEVFSDFQCPACRTLYQDTLRQVMDDYVAAGKVYMIHRDYPLPAHKYAREAARYANAAARIDRLEKVEEALYSRQPTWSVDGNIKAVVAAVLTPKEMVRVRQLLRSSQHQLDAAIEKDVALGGNFQVRQTPTTIITHRGQTYPVVGIVSYTVLRQFLDQLLSQ